MDTAIRSAAEQDCERIAAVYGEFVRSSTATFEIDPPGPAEILRRLHAIRELRLPYLVAQVDGIVAGFAYASQFRPRAAYQHTAEDSIYVAPEFARAGIGTRLLAAVLGACKETGIRQVVAVIGGHNPASVALHAAHGFTHAGTLRRVGRKFDQWLDLTLMQREL